MGFLTSRRNSPTWPPVYSSNQQTCRTRPAHPQRRGGGRGGGGRHGGGGASGTGTAQPGSLPAGDNALDVEFLKGKETSGILDGKPVLLNSSSSASVVFTSSPDMQNNLMQLTAAAFHASYIRQGFKLNLGPAPEATPPAKP